MGGRLTAGPQSYFSNLTCLSSQKEHRPDVPLLLLYCFPTFAQIGRRPKDPAIPAPGTVGKPGSAILLGSGLSARFAGKQQRPLCTFQGEQPVLQWQAAAKARGAAVAANHTMARNDDGDRIRSVCQANRSRRSRRPDFARELPVCQSFTIRDL